MMNLAALSVFKLDGLGVFFELCFLNDVITNSLRKITYYSVSFKVLKTIILIELLDCKYFIVYIILYIVTLLIQTLYKAIT
jgi:hypothetical protein